MRTYLLFTVVFLTLFPFTRNEHFFQYKKEMRTSTALFSNYDKETRNRFFSLSFGEKRGLSKADKKAFTELGIVHLLTPSGLHFKLLTKLPRLMIPGHIFAILCFIFYIVLKVTSYYPAISRILLFHSYSFLKKKFRLKKISYKHIFFITFLTDLLFTTLDHNGMSLVFSFLFWGIILFYSDKKLKCIYLLFCSQLLVSTLMGNNLNFISLIMNPVFTGLFGLSYPLLIFNSLFSFFDFQIQLTTALIKAYFWLILNTNDFFDYLIFKPTFTHFLILLIPLSHQRIKFKLVLIFILLPWSELTRPAKKYNLSSSPKYYISILQTSDIQNRKFNPNGYRLYTKTKICQFTLYEDYWGSRCRKRKPRASRGL